MYTGVLRYVRAEKLGIQFSFSQRDVVVKDTKCVRDRDAAKDAKQGIFLMYLHNVNRTGSLTKSIRFITF